MLLFMAGIICLQSFRHFHGIGFQLQQQNTSVGERGGGGLMTPRLFFPFYLNEDYNYNRRKI